MIFIDILADELESRGLDHTTIDDVLDAIQQLFPQLVAFSKIDESHN